MTLYKVIVMAKVMYAFTFYYWEQMHFFPPHFKFRFSITIFIAFPVSCPWRHVHTFTNKSSIGLLFILNTTIFSKIGPTPTAYFQQNRSHSCACPPLNTPLQVKRFFFIFIYHIVIIMYISEKYIKSPRSSYCYSCKKLSTIYTYKLTYLYCLGPKPQELHKITINFNFFYYKKTQYLKQ